MHSAPTLTAFGTTKRGTGFLINSDSHQIPRPVSISKPCWNCLSAAPTAAFWRASLVFKRSPFSIIGDFSTLSVVSSNTINCCLSNSENIT